MRANLILLHYDSICVHANSAECTVYAFIHRLDLRLARRPNAPLVLACVFSAGQLLCNLNLNAPGVRHQFKKFPECNRFILQEKSSLIGHRQTGTSASAPQNLDLNDIILTKFHHHNYIFMRRRRRINNNNNNNRNNKLDKQLNSCRLFFFPGAITAGITCHCSMWGMM